MVLIQGKGSIFVPKKLRDVVKLSVVVITFNEEKNLARCLESVCEIADEILVVDSFSQDKTGEIALSYGARFLQHPFEGHIEQKNWAAGQAENPFILSLDADECLDAVLSEEVRKAKESWPAGGYLMNRLTNYCGHWVRHCGWYPDTKLRLWDRRLGRWAGYNPHDKFEMNNPGEKLIHLKGNILHYSYYSLGDHYRQVEYFSGISANVLFKRGKRANLIKIYLSPVVKFLNVLFFRLGFLDGISGYRIARISAFGVYLKYKKLQALYTQNELER